MGLYTAYNTLPLDHLLIVGSRTHLFTLLFSLACIINKRHIPSHKMASVGLEPHQVHHTSMLSLPLAHLVVVVRLALFIYLIFFR
jgi:hypothetical protein